MCNASSPDTPIITRIDPKTTLEGPGAETMNFLNEVIGRYPKAISFAAGRPPDAFIPTAEAPGWMDRYLAHLEETTGRSRNDAEIFIGQYSDTGGIVRDLVAKFLAVETEGEIDPTDIMLANGFQEALLVHLIRLARQNGAVVALDPTYVGLTGAAMAAGLPVYAATRALDPIAALQAATTKARADGHRTVAVYIIPDFDNPTGLSLSTSQRHALLAWARDADVELFEDVAYRYFNYDTARKPSLLSLDASGHVVQLGTFSKMFLPGVRIGYAAMRKRDTTANAHALAIKSFTSVATAPIGQAIVGGFLLTCGFRVAEWNKPRSRFCAQNRNLLAKALQRELGGTPAIRWTNPEGGFFTVVKLPFSIGEADMARLAGDYGVIPTPMVFFSPSGQFTHQVRFAFSNTTPEAIDLGIERFARYVKDRLQGRATSNHPPVVRPSA